ncbi:MAG: UDP-3-O-(3-hydroxymyristoyl)glucosamine N-acyltransferase [Micropepsaceae bacterium]
MADARFYDNKGPFTLAHLAASSGAVLGDGVDGDFQIFEVAAAADARAGCIGFLASAKAAAEVDLSSGGAWLTTARLARQLEIVGPTLLHDNPSAAFAAVAHLFYPEAGRSGATDGHTGVHRTARLGEGVILEPGVVVGPGAEIGAGTRIAANTVVGRGVCIGRDGYIGPCATIGYAFLGDRVTVFAGARIGNDGFGFVPTPKGLVKVPQLGRVVVQDDVEIGANCTIDRGALGDTTIGEGSKLDNAVHVAHNCVIGRNVVLAGQVGMAGSVTIGDNVFMGGQVGVGDHLTIGAGARLAAKTGVGKDLPGGQAYGGTPARPIMQWRRETVALTRLVKGMRAKDDE